jgi:hypothetical protein
MSSWLNQWVLTPAFLPAWLQAGAAIVALCISVWAVWRTGAIERRRDRLERRAVAVAVYPEIKMLKETTQNVRDRIADIAKSAGQLMGQSVGASLQFVALIQMPPMLERNTDRLYILGEIAGPSCLQLVRFILQYNDLVSVLITRVMVMNAVQWREAVAQLEEHLRLLDQIVAKCEHEVRPLHDAGGG